MPQASAHQSKQLKLPETPLNTSVLFISLSLSPDAHQSQHHSIIRKSTSEIMMDDNFP